MSNNTRTQRHESPKKKTVKNKKKRSTGSIILKITLGLVFVGCLLFLSGVALFWSYAKDAPKLEEAKLESPNSSKFFAANGDLFQEVGAEKEKRSKRLRFPVY